MPSPDKDEALRKLAESTDPLDVAMYKLIVECGFPVIFVYTPGATEEGDRDKAEVTAIFFAHTEQALVGAALEVLTMQRGNRSTH